MRVDIKTESSLPGKYTGSVGVRLGGYRGAAES